MRYLFVSVGLLLCLLCDITAQENKKINCDQDCVSEEFPFLFCEEATGRKVTKCSADPNHEPGFRALRKRMPPMCSYYDVASLTLLPGVAAIVQGEDIIFDPQLVEGSVFDAAVQWWLASGCPSPQTDATDNCCIRVKWAQTPGDLLGYSGAPDGVLAVTYQPFTPSPGSPSCQVDCNNTWIIMNSTLQFAQLDVNGVPQRFFYNVTEPAGNGLFRNGELEYYHYGSVLLHETGHWYGIGHMGEADSYGRTCGDTRGVCMMAGGVNGLYPGEERTLTDCDDDLCAFRKLYCCAQTAVGVEETNKITLQNFNVYPNPASGAVIIHLDNKLALHNKTVQLINSNGNTIQELRLSAGVAIHSINTDDLPNGTYMIVITAEQLQGSVSKKVIISR